jgi:hypothetical protein
MTMDIPVSFTWIIILFDKALKHGEVANFWCYVEKLLNHSE